MEDKKGKVDNECEKCAERGLSLDSPGRFGAWRWTSFESVNPF